MADKRRFKAEVWKQCNSDTYTVVIIDKGRVSKSRQGLHYKPTREQARNLEYMPGHPDWWVDLPGRPDNYEWSATYYWDE